MAAGRRQRNVRTVVVLGGILVAMLTLVAFSVPLYRLFCAATGYNGTTQRVVADAGTISRRVVTVRFSTSVAPDLPWRFAPLQESVKVHLGEEKLVYFSATNTGTTPTVGHATFNVTPAKIGLYFDKIQCFCFSDELLAPGKTVTMPVDFFVDPALDKDPEAKDVDTITLSYTFFRAEKPDDIENLSRFDPNAPPDPVRGAKLFAERCSGCHALDRVKIGPPLGTVFDRAAGSAPGYPYSPALRHASLAWTVANLDRWLADPQALVPGNKMPIKVLEANARRDIVAYLEHIRADRRTTAATAGAAPAAR
ncbi:MAG: cytochrome c oxidase assembly protein [Alphaproteobacteria bacterium]|nr:cytochrome c oxidase assembly protein [Alphaproteobacteria bacterium]